MQLGEWYGYGHMKRIEDQTEPCHLLSRWEGFVLSIYQAKFHEGALLLFEVLFCQMFGQGYHPKSSM